MSGRPQSRPRTPGDDMPAMETECDCCLESCQCGDCVLCTEAPIRIPLGPVYEVGHYRGR